MKVVAIAKQAELGNLSLERWSGFLPTFDVFNGGCGRMKPYPLWVQCLGTVNGAPYIHSRCQAAWLR